MKGDVFLTRTRSAGQIIAGLIGEARVSIDAALYRLNNPRLVAALDEAVRRGLRVRVVLDRNKYQESRATRELLASNRIPFRLSYGRRGSGSKMPHKFAILDDRLALTGSYNWTLESEEQNFENLLTLEQPHHLEAYRQEFEALWEVAAADSGK